MQLVWILTTIKRKSFVESGEKISDWFHLTMFKLLLILDVSSIVKWFYSPDIHPF